MPGVDSNGLQTRNSTESHNFWIEKNADHIVLPLFYRRYSTNVYYYLHFSKIFPNLLGGTMGSGNCWLGIRDSNPDIQDQNLLCWPITVIPIQMHVLLSFAATYRTNNPYSRTMLRSRRTTPTFNLAPLHGIAPCSPA